MPPDPDIPDEATQPGSRIDREGNILVRRDRVPMPDEEDLDAGPDKDPETGAFRPATYRGPNGVIIRDN